MRLSRRNVLRAAASATALLAAGRAARAQTYPDHPIRLIVPFPPGGAYDTLGRPWADRIKPHLGTVMIENIGGGGASLGAAAAARSRPDGYTLLLGGTLPHVNEALLKSKPLYDPVKDLDPIMRIAVGALAIAVHPSVPVNTLAELVAYIKANPGKVSYGHSGSAGPTISLASCSNRSRTFQISFRSRIAARAPRWPTSSAGRSRWASLGCRHKALASIAAVRSGFSP